MAPDPAEENTNGESDGDLDSPEKPGAPEGGGEKGRDPAEGARRDDLPQGADTA